MKPFVIELLVGFKKFLESEAGHITILTFLFLVGVGVYLWKGDKWIAESFGTAIAYAMRGKNAPSDK